MGDENLNPWKNSNWRDAFNSLPDDSSGVEKLLVLILENSQLIREIISRIDKIPTDSKIENVRDSVIQILSESLSGYAKTFVVDVAKRTSSFPVDTDLIKIVRDTSTSLILLNDFDNQIRRIRQLQLLWQCIRFQIPISTQLALNLLTHMQSDYSGAQHPSEKHTFDIVKTKYPDAEMNLFLGDIELDIYIPSKKVNIEVDSKNSPKGKKAKRRDEFLLKYFGIRVVRFRYNKIVDRYKLNCFLKRENL